MRQPPLPLLLEAFPDVPTYIPVSPGPPSAFPPSPSLAAFNPPPSRPPAVPLPPVPGPSRISDTDTLLFLHSSGTSRSRRSSHLSNRDSVASNRSDLSASTRSSPQTPSSAAQSLHRPSLAFSIDEHAEPQDDLLQSAPLPLKAPLEDLADVDLTVHVPAVMPRSARATPPRHTPRRESISLSSVAMPATDSDTEPDFDALDCEIDASRAPSPDIAAILATTPRPRLTSLSQRPSALPYDEPWEEDFIDDYGQVRGSLYSVASKASGPYAFGYPDAPEADAESIGGADDDHLAWDEPNDSDSDLDLHTSLPQLMLHHGFLSPRSKLLSAKGNTSLAPSPASAVFPSTDPLARDTRDTPKRRVRHRDGKTLAGGIGLTTGLGWSDSEDEDAPSALTHRISSLNLNRSSSHVGLSRASSFSTSTRTSAYARSSAPSRARRTQSEYDEPDVDEFGAWAPTARKTSMSSAGGAGPPTSWARRSEPTSRLSSAQSQASLARMPSIRTDDSGHTTTSAATAASAMSLPLMRSRSRVLRVMLADKEKPLPRTPSLRRNPSTASQFGPTPPSGIRPRAVTGVTPGSLPRPKLAMPSASSSHIPLSMQSTPQPGGPSASTSTAPPVPVPTTSATKSHMRPLRLQPRQPVLGGDRAPVPVPAVLNVGGLSASTTASSLASSTSTSSSALSTSTSATSVSLLSPSASYANVPRSPSPYARGPPSLGYIVPGTPTTPTTPMYDQSGIVRPRPRTGTGMVYRTSTTYAVGAPRGPPRTPVAL